MMSRLESALEGLSAEKIALILAVGLVLGTFPVIGCPTVLCVIAALVLRLNLVPLQLVNQVATPMQIALLFPLARAGSLITGSAAGFRGAVLQAIAGWFFICVPSGILLYLALLFALRRGRAGYLPELNYQPASTR